MAFMHWQVAEQLDGTPNRRERDPFDQIEQDDRSAREIKSMAKDNNARVPGPGFGKHSPDVARGFGVNAQGRDANPMFADVCRKLAGEPKNLAEPAGRRKRWSWRPAAPAIR